MSAGKQKLKYWIGQIHLWLGLISGLVVFIVSVTGCLFVFQKEISELIDKNKFFVSPPEKQASTLPLSVLQQKAQKALGNNQPVNYIITFKDRTRAWEFMAYNINEYKGVTYFDAIDYFRSAFVNPYTGQVTGIRDYKYDFFNIVKYAHWSLMLNSKYGQPIVGWSTFIFVILLISGLVLWWPKKWNKYTRQASFKIKWKARLKRLNYDLHNVLGFYSLLIALILALTGMVWSFKWFENTVYAAASGTTVRAEDYWAKSDTAKNEPAKNAINLAFNQSLEKYPDADRIGVTTPFGKEGVYFVSAYRGKEVYYDRDDLQFDQYSGKLLHTQLNRDKNSGEKLIEMNYDIHVGAIAGLPGKIIAFLISLICASLPVTGFIVWWNKRPGKKNSSRASRSIELLNRRKLRYTVK